MNSKIIPVLLIVVGLAALALAYIGGIDWREQGGYVSIITIRGYILTWLSLPMTFIGIIGILSGIGLWRVQS